MEGEQPYLGDLLTMVIIHLLTGMILQVLNQHGPLPVQPGLPNFLSRLFLFLSGRAVLASLPNETNGCGVWSQTHISHCNICKLAQPIMLQYIAKINDKAPNMFVETCWDGESTCPFYRTQKQQNLEPASILTHEKRKNSSGDLPMLTYSQVQPRCHELPWLYQRPRNQVPMAHVVMFCTWNWTFRVHLEIHWLIPSFPTNHNDWRHLSQAMLYVWAARSEAAKPTVMLVVSIWVLCFCQGTFQITCYLLESGSDKTNGQVTFWKGGVTSQQMNRPLWKIHRFESMSHHPVSKGTSWLHLRLFFWGGRVPWFSKVYS